MESRLKNLRYSSCHKWRSFWKRCIIKHIHYWNVLNNFKRHTHPIVKRIHNTTQRNIIMKNTIFIYISFRILYKLSSVYRKVFKIHSSWKTDFCDGSIREIAFDDTQLREKEQIRSVSHRLQSGCEKRTNRLHKMQMQCRNCTESLHYLRSIWRHVYTNTTSPFRYQYVCGCRVVFASAFLYVIRYM